MVMNITHNEWRYEERSEGKYIHWMFLIDNLVLHLDGCLFDHFSLFLIKTNIVSSQLFDSGEIQHVMVSVNS